MADLTLSPQVYDRRGADNRMTCETLIEDFPQVSIRRVAPSKLERLGFTSPLSDNFPTPRAVPNNTHALFAEDEQDSSDSEHEKVSAWNNSIQHNEFDDLYDISEESDQETLPSKLSASVKRRIGGRKADRPTLVIPSPGHWPTIDKLRATNTTLSPTAAIVLSPRALQNLNSRSQILPSTSSAPSLDGSMTSEELAISSCPSTPDLSAAGDNDEWEPPAQLTSSAFSLLQQLNGQHGFESAEKTQASEEARPSEMSERVTSAPLFGHFQLKTQNLPVPSSQMEDELSALSVPSPGGFFASLDSSVRRTWSGTAAEPTTSTATEFYGVPWRMDAASDIPPVPALPSQFRSDLPVEQKVTMPVTVQDGPETARKGCFSPTELVREVDEIDETYGVSLQQSAAANLDRTAVWLCSQDQYMKAVCEDEDELDSFQDIADAVPKTPEQASPVSDESSPGKKSVRFAETQTKKVAERVSPIHDGTFWEGWRHNKRSARARDVFQQRQMRVEAEHVRRTSCSKSHSTQLGGKFEVQIAERPAPQRPVSNFLPVATDEEQKALIGQVEKERLALEQMQSSMWCTAAQKEVNGGGLLTSPVVQTFRGRSDVRILDLAGQVHCGWAWTIAGDHPEAHVFTTVASDVEAHVAELSLEGPENHSVVAAPNLWELPFPSNHFDVISARNLYSHLRTLWPGGKAADEYDLTLRECLRCLKPGGFLEFGLLDAEMLHPTSASQALGVEFAFNLKTRGYDPSAGKNFLPRLKRAGFGEIKRAWMVLPVADVTPRWTDPAKKNGEQFGTQAQRSIGPNGEVQFYPPPTTGTTRDVRAVTGLVGARMWEQWMLKLNTEMGRSEERCLEGVSKALEESGRGNASWRCLVGWAKKE